MNNTEFRRLDDQVIYFGTLDDVVYRYPWRPEHSIHPSELLRAIQSELITAAIYNKTVVINDGYLVANPLLVPDIINSSTSLIGSMIKGQAAYIYARGGETNLIAGLESTAKNGDGVKTHAAVMADKERWHGLRNGLERLEYHSRNNVIPWPKDKNMGHVFYVLMKRLADLNNKNSRTTIPEKLKNDFFEIFEKFEGIKSSNFDKARTVWEELTWTHFRGSDLDKTTLGAGRFSVEELRIQPEYERVRVMMNIANEMYHLAQSSGVFRGLALTPKHPLSNVDRVMGVATAFQDNLSQNLIQSDFGVTENNYIKDKLGYLFISIPQTMKFGKDFSFIERLRDVASVRDARDNYLNSIWKFMNGNEKFDVAAMARDEYIRCLAEILYGYVILPRSLQAVDKLIGFIKSASLSNLGLQFGVNYLVNLGFDSLKTPLIERVVKRQIELSLQEEALEYRQNAKIMARDRGLYVGPLDHAELTTLLSEVGPHP